MQKLVDGVRHFQTQVFAPQRELFEVLAKGQSPHTLFVACSDSRIDPNLITNSKPGELFVVRNPGNLVAPHGTPSDVGAAVEFALTNFRIRDIVVCGHTSCGAMRGLLIRRKIVRMPTVARWLRHAETVRCRLEGRQDLEGEAWLNVAAELNVLVQLEHLGTYPIVAEHLARGDLQLHGWVYHLATGGVSAHNAHRGAYLPLTGPDPAPPELD